MTARKWQKSLSLPVATRLAVMTGGFLLRIIVILGLLWWPGSLLF